MKREIKFRFWDKENKKIINQFARNLEYFIDLYGSAYCNETSPSDSVLYEMEDCKIMQCTGLTDCDGKEIYEGDILENIELDKKFGWRNLQLVSFEDGSFWKRSIDKEVYDSDILRQGRAEAYKIIGNLYQNPELLE